MSTPFERCRAWLAGGLMAGLAACASHDPLRDVMQIDRGPRDQARPINLAQLPGRRVQLFVRVHPAEVSKSTVSPDELRRVEDGVRQVLDEALRQRGFEVLDDLRPLKDDPVIRIGGFSADQVEQSRANAYAAVLGRANAGGPASIVHVCLRLARSDELKEFVSFSTSSVERGTVTETTTRTNVYAWRFDRPVLYLAGGLSSQCNLFGTSPFTLATSRGSRLRELSLSPVRVAAVDLPALAETPPSAGTPAPLSRVPLLGTDDWARAIGRDFVAKLPSNWVPQP